MNCDRLIITDQARAIIDQLRATHGELMFHQSGGCCDGSAPMCFAQGEFLIGSQDVYLGKLYGCPFYMAADQFTYYRNMCLTIDVTPGRGASFSLEAPLGVRFISLSRLLTEQELACIQPVIMPN
jgi:hypothetical protein